MEEHEQGEYSTIAIDHARNPRNMGLMPVFDGHGSVTGSCGDSMDFWIRVQEDSIAEARFATDGCGSSMACGSMATELLRNRSIAGAMLIRPREVLEAFQGFPEESSHCAQLAIDAFQAACEDFFRSIPMGAVRRKFLVVSAKGGVGKSTVAVHFARKLASAGWKVGLLDADIHGPCVPQLLGTGPVALERRGDRLAAHDHHGIKVMSMGFVSPDPDRAVSLRGPRKTMLVRQFLREVDWGDIDAMVIDTPAGTGDELLTVVKSAGILEGAIVVTTPDEIAIQGARRSIAFCREMGVRVLGLLENMAGRGCPLGAPSGGISQAESMAEDLTVAYLGALPFAGGTHDEPSLEFSRAIDALFDPLVASPPAT